jgi:hypothetical protein
MCLWLSLYVISSFHLIHSLRPLQSGVDKRRRASEPLSGVNTLTPILRSGQHVSPEFYRAVACKQARKAGQALSEVSALRPRCTHMGEEYLRQGPVRRSLKRPRRRPGRVRTLERRPALRSQGRPNRDGITVKDVANAWKFHKDDKVKAGELSPRTRSKRSPRSFTPAQVRALAHHATVPMRRRRWPPITSWATHEMIWPACTARRSTIRG